MANHRAAALLLVASLLVAVVLSGVDARPDVHPNKTPVADPGANDVVGRGLADAAAAVVADPECDGENGKPDKPKRHHPKKPNDPNYRVHTNNTAESPYSMPDSVEQELCSDCEEPKTPEPPCSTCEEPKMPEPPCSSCEEPKEPGLKCNKVHAVRDGETCYSMGQCAGPGLDDFLSFNPNVCCDNLFVGQWVCLDATCDA